MTAVVIFKVVCVCVCVCVYVCVRVCVCVCVCVYVLPTEMFAFKNNLLGM